jgi:tRNA threonylcarbamoyladenosine biosynthesis protein TsaB
LAAARSVILAIETSNPSSQGGAGVAVGRADSPDAPPTVLDVEPLSLVAGHDDDLMPAIDRLARRAGITPREIGRIAVSIGPGGFTALRIAIATAKMIAQATGARTVGIPTADVVARRVSEAAASAPFAIALASKADAAFVTLFGPHRRPLRPGAVLRSDAFDALVQGEDAPRTLIADMFVPKGFHQISQARRISIEQPRFDPVACLEASLSRPGRDPLELVPLYAREPEAVTLWRNRNA